MIQLNSSTGHEKGHDLHFGQATSYLKQVVIDQVFVRAKQETIANANGRDARWLFDFRRVLLQPDVLESITEVFYKRFGRILPVQIGGIEVAAIPLITGIVMSLHRKGITVNGFFIRKSRKKDGLMRMIEGSVNDDKIVLVDDIMNTGKSFIRQVEVIESLGKKVHAVFSILRFRDIQYYSYFQEKGIEVMSIFTLEDFRDSLETRNARSQEKMPSMPFRKEWYFRSNGASFSHVISKSKPVIDTQRLYFGSDSGTFWALNQLDGSIAWKYELAQKKKQSHIFSSPATDDLNVYFGAHDGNVYALDKESGRRQWVFMDADWIHSSPLVVPDHHVLYVGVEFGWWKKSGAIIALNTSTGDRLWQFQVPGNVFASPAYSKKENAVLCGGSSSMYALAATNGSLLWEIKTEHEVRSKAGTDEASNSTVFGTSEENGFVYIVDTKTGTIKHKILTAGWILSDIIITNGVALVPTLAKILYAIDIQTGRIKWTFETRGRIFASPVVIEDKIYMGSNDARLYEIDLATGKETAFFQATERITNAIAYNAQTKKIFLPTFANEIYCLTRT